MKTFASAAFAGSSVASRLFLGAALAKLLYRSCRWVCCILIVVQLLPSIAAQSKDNFEPTPYAENEFPQFLQDVRRFEVILIGSIPITLLLTSLIYDIIYSISEPNISTLEIAGQPEQLFQKIGISISISGILAIVDMAIHLGKRQKRRKEREKLLRNSEYLKPRAKRSGAPPDREKATEPGSADATAPQGN